MTDSNQDPGTLVRHFNCNAMILSFVGSPLFHRFFVPIKGDGTVTMSATELFYHFNLILTEKSELKASQYL